MSDSITDLPIGTRIQWEGGGGQIHEGVIMRREHMPKELEAEAYVYVEETVVSVVPHFLRPNRKVEVVE